jgi:hypothetical protein
MYVIAFVVFPQFLDIMICFLKFFPVYDFQFGKFLMTNLQAHWLFLWANNWVFYGAGAWSQQLGFNKKYLHSQGFKGKKKAS